MDEKERRTLLTDNWNGFANLLANLVEKYAAVLDIESSGAVVLFGGRKHI